MGFHLFQSEERPTEEFTIAERGNLLDLNRRGIELSAHRDHTWSGGRLLVSARGLWNEIELERGPLVRRLDQRIGSLAGGWAGLRRRGSWRLEPGLALRGEAGRTEGSSSWLRYGGTARLGIGHHDARLRLSWTRNTSEDVGYGFDLYQVGGGEVTILPETALSGRIAVPALPVGTLLGTDHEGQRAELALGLLPAPVFYERHRTWGQGREKGDWLSLAGLEYRFSLAPLPLGRLPGLDLRVGVARILDEPFQEEVLEGETRWWVVTTWRP